MTIYNKDGSIFKIQGINPLMKDQERWKEKWVVYDVVDKVTLPDPKRNFAHVNEDDNFAPSILGVGPIQQKDVVHCVPLIVTYEEDPLYGQKKKQTDFGEKFSFEAVTLNSNGLTAIFFANVPAERVPQGSIIYVYNERQWWKVNGTEDAENGIHIFCIPSDLKPSLV
jgi:hypothetical protein